MNHLQIATIVQVIDNYFLLFDAESATSIKAKKDSSANIEGLTIYRNLRNGWIEITIRQVSSEKYYIAVYYHQKGSTSEHNGAESIDPEDFSLESITKAIRKMVVYDSEVKKPKNNDVVLSPNNK